MISMPILSRAKSYAWAIFSLRKKKQTTKTIEQVFSSLKNLYLRAFFVQQILIELWGTKRIIQRLRVKTGIQVALNSAFIHF